MRSGVFFLFFFGEKQKGKKDRLIAFYQFSLSVEVQWPGGMAHTTWLFFHVTQRITHNLISLLEGVLDPGHSRLLTRSRVDFLCIEDRMISETAADPVA